ncbi:hypothetical protein OBBRIDRAFT_886965 [Obba rivulosa]|uniref:RanBD1 domain-containing protein n=1 Tax=Obba rivulosa TaxID=1052685 RepID=A0A8E2B078_9APHY|nr:hypothetical protein OBBRIDRAFT_886965 [Obba rivulosa]
MHALIRRAQQEIEVRVKYRLLEVNSARTFQAALWRRYPRPQSDSCGSSGHATLPPTLTNMKRGAEKQMTKDDDPEEEFEDVGQGFKKADETVLASRQIKGLPKRALAGSGSVAPPAAPASAGSSTVPKFTGFAGFGSTSGNSSPFTFAGSAAPKAPVPTTSASSGFGFGTSSAGTASATTTSTSTPTPAPLSSRTFGPAPDASSSMPVQSTPPVGSSSGDNTLTAEIEYYKALRGLNNSIVSAVSKAVESDPFTDVAELLERYKSFRLTAKAEYDEKLRKIQAGSSIGPPTASSASISAKPPPTMPAPPTSFAAFGEAISSKPSPFTVAPTATSSSASSDKSGETDSIMSSTFSSATFGSSSMAPSDKADTAAKSSVWSFGNSSAISPGQDLSTDSTKRSPFELASPPASTDTSSSIAKRSPFEFTAPSSSFAASKSPFTFAPSNASGTTASAFTFGSSSSTSSTSAFGAFSSAPSSFAGGNVFGKSAEKEKDKEAMPSKDKASDEDSKTAPSTGASPFGGQSVFGTTDKSSMVFGLAGASKPSGFGAPAKAAGSIGNPVGFGFGSPPRTPEAETYPVSKASPFVFAPSKPAEPDAESTRTPSEIPAKKSPWEFDTSAPKLKPADWSMVGSTDDGGSTSAEGTPGPESGAEVSDSAQPLVSSQSIHDMEGEGEEHEETMHEIRSKVFKMVKHSDKSEWGDMGVGILRLKRHRETESRRLLLRNSSTGRVAINFIIYAGMTPTVQKNVVSFIGHDEGASTAFRIRTKTDEQANALKKALDREIEFVQAKSEMK